jgi:predicted TIM-barrel fold metal-dependent hydrolase
MSIVDTHCHASLDWFEPIETLLFQMDTYGVDKAVLVQHGGEYDNSYLLTCAEQHSGRFTVMGLVDPTRADATGVPRGQRLRGVGSVRLFAPTESGGDPIALWRKAAELGMPVSSPSNAFELTTPSFQTLIQELPDLPIILEHYGFLRLPEDQRPDALRSARGLPQRALAPQGIPQPLQHGAASSSARQHSGALLRFLAPDYRVIGRAIASH